MIAVAALYRFAAVPDREGLRARLLAVADAEGVKGTLLVADEGVNGTVAGSRAGLERLVAAVRAEPGFAGTEIKWSEAAAMPFHRLKVRLKREIVTMGEPGLDAADVGTYVAPADWNALIDDPDTVVIDTRNA